MPSTPVSKNDKRPSVDGVDGKEKGEGSQSMTEAPATKDDVVVNVDLLAPIQKEKRVLIEWKTLSAFVPSSFIPKNRVLEASKAMMRAMSSTKLSATTERETTPDPLKQIVFDVSGFVRPGEVAALMGPSGSGKTTLISILGGRQPKLMTVTGTATFNGQPMSKAIRRSIGYVSQDDLLYETLTTYETLFYAALLRLPQKLTRSEKLDRVEAVMEALGLNKCRNTLIGSDMRRGVSGGERKRVSVGHELLINPSVLILDEPTSGLDSTTAMQLITILCGLASGGRAILTTIHQPSSRIYSQLNTVMLLSEGHVLYYGNSSLTVDWFSKQGFEMPYGVNVAEYILDLANGNIAGGGMDEAQSRLFLIDSMTDHLNERPAGYLESEEEMQKQLSMELKEMVSSPAENDSSSKAFLSPENKADRWGASFLDQIIILTSRSVRHRRFSSISTQLILQTIAVSIASVALWWQTGEGDTLLTASDITALIFFVLIYVNFSQLFNAIYTFPNVFNLMVKERASGMYRLLPFYMAETLSDLPMDYSVPCIFIISAYWGCHLRQSAGAFLAHVTVMLISGLSIQTIGLLLGATVTSPKTAVSFASVLMIVLMLTTGFWVRDIPDGLEWLKYLGSPYWAFRVLLQIEFSDRNYVDCGGVGETQKPRDECIPIEDIGEELNVNIDVDGAKWKGIIATFGIMIFLRVLTYFVLRRKTRFQI